MSKRGETRPFRVIFEWSNGVKGVATYGTADEAEMCANEIRRNAEHRNDSVLVVVKDRRNA